ncbi:hypothetical protein I302_102434 [Kwoniella bestiolae CBS 10118]|uniref:Uncharacterized protein n=1 Tax=Kwoniella bestiolae CBS 10118 TaxID=1296100 RepID=A0A1B9GF67_9TREE|nr:hypothetical protein I302_01124 [Kwoniella bestiolae CBS 10118]OCF29615.1 hypothetical protein I302_01124 [Kwoniella bestiolae CBS 10118]
MRPGHGCTIDIPDGTDDLLEGGFNIVFEITFDDGVKWVARVRKQSFKSPPGEIRSMIHQSEVESMKILYSATGLVPLIHVPPEEDIKSDGELEYFFLDFVQGESLHPPILNGEETPERLKNIIHDYALFQIKIKSKPFDLLGSICPPSRGSTSPTVGPLLHMTLRSDHPPYFIGPFKSNKERYLSQIDFVLGMIEKRVIYPQDPSLIYLFHLDLKDMINRYDKWEDDEEERFYFKHADDKGDHIFTDEDGHITGVIDWEWTYVTSKAEAFSSPLAMIPPSSFWDGDNTLSSLEEMLIVEYENLGHPDLAKCVREGKIYQRLNLLLGYYPDLKHLNALRELITNDEVSFFDEREYQEWCVDRFGEDSGYLKLCGHDDK